MVKRARIVGWLIFGVMVIVATIAGWWLARRNDTAASPKVTLTTEHFWEADSEHALFHENKIKACDMCTNFANSSVIVSKSKYKGRGVFANKDIQKGATIEICPILLELKHNIPENNVLTDYVFSTGVEGEVAFSMGYCGLFNHDDQPNAVWAIDRNRRTVEIKATRPIRKGEEIFVSYGEKYWNTRNIKRDAGSLQAA